MRCFVRQLHPYFGILVGRCEDLPGGPRHGTRVLILESRRVRGGELVLVQYVSRGGPVRAILPKEGYMFQTPRGPRPPWRHPNNPSGAPPEYPRLPWQIQPRHRGEGADAFQPPGYPRPPWQLQPQHPTPCGPKAPCPAGTTCIGGRCLPSRYMNPNPALSWRFA